METSEVNHYHHQQPAEPTINLSVEKNSRGYNWSVTVVGAKSVDQAMDLIMKAQVRLRGAFEEREVTT